MPTMLLLLIPLVLLLSGIVYGIECATRVSHALAREHENSTYALLALCPPGSLAVSWVICTSVLYRNREFERLYDVIQSSINIALIGIGILFVLVLLVSFAAAAPFNNGALTPNLLVIIGVIFAVMYWEFVQSVLLGCVVGLLTPTYTMSSLDAGLFAPGVFLMLKMVVYSVSALVGLNILPDVFVRLRLDGPSIEMILTVLRGLIFIAIQEGAIRLTWQHLMKRVNASNNDVQWALYPTK